MRTGTHETGKTVPGFSLRAIPTTLVLDKSGRIIGRITGPRDWDSRESIVMFERLVDPPGDNLVTTQSS